MEQVAVVASRFFFLAFESHRVERKPDAALQGKPWAAAAIETAQRLQRHVRVH
jgi:hypothetical protein